MHVFFGEITVNGQILAVGDSAAVEGEGGLEILGTGSNNAEVLLFDLARSVRLRFTDCRRGSA